MKTILAACVGLALVAACATAQPAAHPGLFARDALDVAGPSGAFVLSAADLAALPRHRVTLDIHGTQHVFEGAALIDVLARGGAPHGEAMRGPALADVVLVTARDGYQIALALSDADPGISPHQIIIADRMDGAPIAEDGPLRLVVEGDLRAARSARQVARIEWMRLPR